MRLHRDFWGLWRLSLASFGLRGFRNYGIDCNCWRTNLRPRGVAKKVQYRKRRHVVAFQSRYHVSLVCTIRSATHFTNARMERGSGTESASLPFEAIQVVAAPRRKRRIQRRVAIRRVAVVEEVKRASRLAEEVDRNGVGSRETECFVVGSFVVVTGRVELCVSIRPSRRVAVHVRCRLPVDSRKTSRACAVARRDCICYFGPLVMHSLVPSGGRNSCIMTGQTQWPSARQRCSSTRNHSPSNA